ncbi:MAG: hypothetical protein EBT19_02720 [Methylocystaceae bacterium]|nr:hypothetical protein [Methylocystaceae bacterium]
MKRSARPSEQACAGLYMILPQLARRTGKMHKNIIKSCIYNKGSSPFPGRAAPICADNLDCAESLISDG